MRRIATTLLAGAVATGAVSCGGGDGRRVATDNGVRFERQGKELTLVIEDDAPQGVRAALQGHVINVFCVRRNDTPLVSARATFPAKRKRVVLRTERDLSSAFSCGIEHEDEAEDIATVQFRNEQPEEVERAVPRLKESPFGNATSASCEPEGDDAWTCELRTDAGEVVTCFGLIYSNGRITRKSEDQSTCVYR